MTSQRIGRVIARPAANECMRHPPVSFGPVYSGFGIKAGPDDERASVNKLTDLPDVLRYKAIAPITTKSRRGASDGRSERRSRARRRSYRCYRPLRAGV